MTKLSTRREGRRPNSAKARNRGRWGAAVAIVAAVVDRLGLSHDVSALIGVGAGVGPCLDSQPGSKVSMTIIRA